MSRFADNAAGSDLRSKVVGWLMTQKPAANTVEIAPSLQQIFIRQYGQLVRLAWLRVGSRRMPRARCRMPLWRCSGSTFSIEARVTSSWSPVLRSARERSGAAHWTETGSCP